MLEVLLYVQKNTNLANNIFKKMRENKEKRCYIEFCSIPNNHKLIIFNQEQDLYNLDEALKQSLAKEISIDPQHIPFLLIKHIKNATVSLSYPKEENHLLINKRIQFHIQKKAKDAIHFNYLEQRCNDFFKKNNDETDTTDNSDNIVNIFHEDFLESICFLLEKIGINEFSDIFCMEDSQNLKNLQISLYYFPEFKNKIYSLISSKIQFIPEKIWISFYQPMMNIIATKEEVINLEKIYKPSQKIEFLFNSFYQINKDSFINTLKNLQGIKKDLNLIETYLPGISNFIKKVITRIQNEQETQSLTQMEEKDLQKIINNKNNFNIDQFMLTLKESLEKNYNKKYIFYYNFALLLESMIKNQETILQKMNCLLEKKYLKQLSIFFSISKRAKIQETISNILIGNIEF